MRSRNEPTGCMVYSSRGQGLGEQIGIPIPPKVEARKLLVFVDVLVCFLLLPSATWAFGCMDKV